MQLFRMAKTLHTHTPVIAAVLCSAIDPTSLAGADATRKVYNLPDGDAAITLGQFARDSGVQIAYMVENVRGEKTKAVRGEFLSIEALRRMLAGSALFAVQDEATGAIVVSRRQADPPASPERRVQPSVDAPPVSQRPTESSKSPPPKVAETSGAKRRSLLPFLAGWLISGANVDLRSATPPPKEEAIVLSVFEVNADDDDEYRAANTTTGTSYKTPIKDLPMNIEVLTSAFMRDIGALDVRDALEYVSGLQLDLATAGPTNSSKDNPENSTVLIRGIAATTNKDGFRHFVAVDPITISRADVIKGPGGALYGQGGTGGVVNVASVQAGRRPVARLNSTLGSFDFRRVEFLWSGPLDKGGRFGLAIPMSYQANKSSAMYFETNTFVMNPALTVKLGPKTTFLASLESRFAFRDNIRNFFLADTLARAPDGSFYGTLIPGRVGNTRVLTTPNQRDFRFEGPDTFRKDRTYVRTYRIDHRFSDTLQWWAGFNMEDINVRERFWSIALRNSTDAAVPLKIRTDPRFTAMLRPGTPQQILDIRPNNVANSARTTRQTWKSELYHAFETGPVKHRMVAGITYGTSTSGNSAPNQNFYYGLTSLPNDPATRLWEALPNDVILSRFRDPRDFTSVKRWDYAMINQYPQGPELAIGTPASYLTNYFWERSIYGNLQSSFFGSRVQTIVGFFATRNDRAGIVYDVNGTELWSGPAPAGSPSGTLNGSRRPEPVRNTAPSVTAIWLPADWVRLYVNAMSAIDAGAAYSAYDGNGQPLSGAVVRNGEAGLRLDLLQSKILVNMVGFAMKDYHRPVSYASAIQNLLVAPTGITNFTGFTAFLNTTTESKGFDLKVDYLPIRNLRFNVGLSKNDVEVTEIDPFVPAANPDPVRLAAQQRFLAAGGSSSQYLGKSSRDISKYTGSAFLRYEFQKGLLRSTWVMLGAKYLGEREAEVVTVNTTTGDIVVDNRFVPSHYLYDFNMGYRRKVGRCTANLQLNVANLANDEEFYGTAWQVGRTFRFSVGLNF